MNHNENINNDENFINYNDNIDDNNIDDNNNNTKNESKINLSNKSVNMNINTKNDKNFIQSNLLSKITQKNDEKYLTKISTKKCLEWEIKMLLAPESPPDTPRV